MSAAEMKKQILDKYYDVEAGLTSANDIYKKLNKKYTLKQIKEVLDDVKNKQTKENKQIKIYIPIITPANSYSADLTFYTQYKNVNGGCHILLTIINNNTNKAFLYPLKNKLFKTIIEAFIKFLQECGSIDQLQCDMGSEFKAKEFQKICESNKIKLLLFNTSENKNTMGIIERFNKTIRDKIANYMAAYHTKKYIDVLDKLVKNYNNTVHSSTKLKPNEVDEKNEKDLIINKNIDYIDTKQEINNAFAIGDNVRLQKKSKTFAKGKKETYSKTIYEITEINDNKIISGQATTKSRR